MGIENMTTNELIERRSAIATEIDADGADLEALEAEVRAINAELEKRAAAENRRNEIRKYVANGKMPVVGAAPKADRNKKTVDEIRSSAEYDQAFLNGWRSGDKQMKECRALLTEQATDADLGITGYVPVPTRLETEIRTAWEESKLLQLCGKADFAGDIKIAFEVSATGASKHKEGTDGPNEEEVVLGTVKIENEYIKKWIQVSDKALYGTTINTAGYLYREIAHRIVEEAEKELIELILAAPETATTTAVGVPQLEVSELDACTVLDLICLLAGNAQDLKLIMSKTQYAALKRIEKSAGYYVDVFEGLQDDIIFTDAIDAYATASSADPAPFMIAGDFARGALINYPHGDSVEILVDPYTAAEDDLVKIVGKELIGMGLVNDKHFAVGLKNL